MAELKINSQFSVTDDQLRAMSDLVEGLKRKEKWQTLLGVTGSGKTFTMANICLLYTSPSPRDRG